MKDNLENSMVVGADEEYEERFGGPEEEELTDEDNKKIIEMCLAQGHIDSDDIADQVMQSEAVLSVLRPIVKKAIERDSDSFRLDVAAKCEVIKIYSTDMTKQYIEENK